MNQKYLITRIIGIVAVALVIFLSGCAEQLQNNDNSVIDEKTIIINGADKNQEINSDTPVKLIINGFRNTITVKENTQINEIIINGVDVTIHLPKDNNPIITDNGVRTQISYY